MCAGGLLTANAQDNFISRYIATNDSLERAINEDQELVAKASPSSRKTSSTR